MSSVLMMVVLGVWPARSGANARPCFERPDRDCLLQTAFDAAYAAKRPALRAKLLARTAEAMSTAGRRDVALRTLRAARAATMEASASSDQIAILQRIAVQQHRLGSAEAARLSLADGVALLRERLADATAETYPLNPLLHLAAVQALVGPSDDLTAMLGQASEMAASHPDAALRSANLILIATAQAALDTETAKPTLDRLRSVSESRRVSIDRASGLMTVTGLYAQFGLGEAAREAGHAAYASILEIIDDAERTRYRGSLAIVMLAVANEDTVAPTDDQTDADACFAKPSRTCLLAQASHAAETVSQPGLLIAIAAKDHESGATGTARRRLLQARAASERLSNAHQRLLIYEEVADRQAEFGDRAGARDTLAIAADDLRNLAAQDPRSWLGTILSLAARRDALGDKAAAGMFSESVRIAGSIDEPSERCARLLDIAEAQATAHRSDAAATFGRAVDAASAIPYAELRAEVLTAVAFVQAQAGLSDEARQTVRAAYRELIDFDTLTDRAPAVARIALVLLMLED